MTDNDGSKGWLRWVFGAPELEQGRQAPRAEADERTRDALDELLSTPARAADEHLAGASVQALRAQLAEVLAEVTLLRGAHVAAEARVLEVEADCQQMRRELERAAASHTDAQRKAEIRGVELDKLRKRLKALETQRTELEVECRRLAAGAELSARENKELLEKLELADRLVPALKSELERARRRPPEPGGAEQRLAALGSELEQARAAAREVDPLRRAKQALEDELAGCQSALSDLRRIVEVQTARRLELERDLARVGEVAAARERQLQATQEELRSLFVLAAHAVDAVLGSESHLAVEAAFAASGATPAQADAGALNPAAEGLRARLIDVGLVSRLGVELRGDALIGHIAAAPTLDAVAGSVCARWLAAYTTEWLNRALGADRRLERLESTPEGFTWTATPRRWDPSAPH